MCTYYRDIYTIAIAPTNLPLSSVRTWTLFHHPLLKCMWKVEKWTMVSKIANVLEALYSCFKFVLVKTK